MIAKAIGNVLTRVGFDRAVERGGVKRALQQSNYDASDIVGKLVYYALLLFVLQLAFGVFGPTNPISELLTQIITFLPSLVVAIIIIVIAAAIAAAVGTLVQGTLGGLSYGRLLAGIASGVIVFLGVIAALNQVGVATTVTTPVLVTVLATIAGVIIVGAGGGLIRPMQSRWEGWLSSAEAELPRMKEQAANAPSAREQAEQAKQQAQAKADEQERAGADTQYTSDPYASDPYASDPYASAPTTTDGQSGARRY